MSLYIAFVGLNYRFSCSLQSHTRYHIRYTSIVIVRPPHWIFTELNRPSPPHTNHILRGRYLTTRPQPDNSPTRTPNTIITTTMCYQIVERYAACGCIYHRHGVDPCPASGRHAPTERTVPVGYMCPSHESQAGVQSSGYGHYSSGSSSRSSGHRSSGRSRH